MSPELKEIIEKHQAWLRKDPKGVRADLSSRDLSNTDLSGVNLSMADLSYANLENSDFTEADLSFAVARGIWLCNTKLNRAYCANINLFAAALEEVDLSEANLRDAVLTDAYIRRSDITDTIFDSTQLRFARFYYMDARTCSFEYANFSKAGLRDINLEGTALEFCSGNGKEIKSLSMSPYHIVWTNTHIYICDQMLTLDEVWDVFPWEASRNEESMKWWKTNKDTIRALIKNQ